MREIFDTFLTDPVLLSEDVFALWLEGQNTSNALEIRFRSYAHPPPVSSTLDYSETNELDQLRDLIWRDTVDQYRLFEKLEMYLMQPLLLRTQLLFQIPPWQQLEMTEKYYGFDGAVVRRLLGKKLTSRAQKDLDEVSENSLRTLKKSVYNRTRQKNFQGPLTRLICEQFLISEKLAAKYACVVFLLHGRFEVHPSHKLVGFLSWHDVQFFAALLMGHWVAPSTKRHHHSKLDAAAASVKPLSFSVLTESSSLLCLRRHRRGDEMSSTLSTDGHSSLDWPNLAFLEARVTPMSARTCVGVDLNQRMTNSLRDLKAHFLNDADTLNEYRNLVMVRFSSESPLADDVILELKDLIEDLVDAAGIVFKDSKLRLDDIDVIFSALIEWGRRLAILGGLIRGVPSSLGSIDVWYLNADDTRLHLLASWELFLSVCRAILVTIYDRI
ncbi:hypothetical protein DYB32_002254 [Aphanomyces invadans]|uniref:Acidic fibroblast growth factor intracellular-binding protein n=1 Tax=Aphanomyces invadans TaxID=157072 RepID=A0A418B411_9STRA|nr:hypothetical protein DYB32_002254 [Aphanomyces invadans]